MAEDKTGVILLNLGGPDSLDSVKPFLYNLFSDREIIQLGPSFLQKPIARLIAATRSGKTKGNYRHIGGRSPILEITRNQAEALRQGLKVKGLNLRTYVGMRYWHPFIGEAVKEAAADRVTKLIALPLFPQHSRATTGSCFNELKRAVSNLDDKIDVTYIMDWHDNPLYTEALADTITHGLSNLSSKEKKDAYILFSAHALPQRFIDEGDPYVDQVRETIHAVSGRLKIENCGLSFQSRSGPVRWIGPSTEEALKKLSKEGVKSVLIVPVSFVSDHVETLYEMDILYKEYAEKLGINLFRASSLNTSSRFIEALVDIVENSLVSSKKT